MKPPWRYAAGAFFVGQRFLSGRIAWRLRLIQSPRVVQKNMCLIDYNCCPLYTVAGDSMNLGAYMKNQGISVYSLSKKASVPYTTLCSICNGTANVMECRVNTILKIAESLGVSLIDVINGSLSVPKKHNFINDEIEIDSSALPKGLKNTIKELEEYDQNNDAMFYECADMLYMMADRFLKDGAIDRETRDKLIMKYPIA